MPLKLYNVLPSERGRCVISNGDAVVERLTGTVSKDTVDRPSGRQYTPSQRFTDLKRIASR